MRAGPGWMLATLGICGAIAVLGGGGPRPAHAANFVVTTQADEADTAAGDSVCLTASGECSLRAAIQEARFAADSTITLPAGFYLLSVAGAAENEGATGDLDIRGENLTITGAGPGLTVVDANGLDRVFQVLDTFGPISVTLSGMTIRNGNPGAEPGGAIHATTGLRIENCVVSVSTTLGNGGGIMVTGEGMFELVDSEVRANTGVAGGGLALFSENISIENSTIAGNTAERGAGIFNQGESTMLVDTEVDGNVAAGAIAQGGGILNDNGGDLRMTGGAVRINEATSGGGIANEGSLVISGALIVGNTASSFLGGGGMLNLGAPAEARIEDSWVADNVTPGPGGGLYNQGGPVEIDGVTFSGNSGSAGGAIANASVLTMLNSTVSGNFGTDHSPGLWNSGDGTANVLHVTFAGDTPSTPGDTITTSEAAVTTLTSSVLDGQCAGAGLVSAGGNIEHGDSCGLDGPGDEVDADPRLLALANTGGVGPTHRLGVGSPAHGRALKAECPPVDQRGILRPQGIDCDSGAVETVGGGVVVGPFKALLPGLTRD